MIRPPASFALACAIFGLIPRGAAAQDSVATDADTVGRPIAADTSILLPRTPPRVTLSLADALSQGRKSSPAYRQVLNDAGPAKWGVRSAYGSFLPSLSVSSDVGYTGSGQSNFGGGFTRPTSSFVTSGYSLGLDWQLNGRTLSGPGQQKSLERATAEEIGSAGVTLTADITARYLTVLQATAQVDVARQQVRRNADFLGLAQARHQVGQATLLDVRQAEVTKGTGDVALLRAVQAENEAKLELLRIMGVVPPVPIDEIALSDSFPVQRPDLHLDRLLQLAERQNPSLRALRARQNAAGWETRAAKSEFLPTLSLQAGWSGFTQQFTNDRLLLDQALIEARQEADNCRIRTALNLGGTPGDCFADAGLTSGGATLLDPVTNQIRSQNSVFPFHYTGQPFRANLTISLPIFTGFGRSLRVSQARAQEQDVDENVRARALQVRTEVHARFLGVETSYKAIAVQEQSRAAARDQLRLAQDRYRLGAGASLEVSDAQNAVQQAEGDYVNAVYDYHKAVAALEAAVGHSLR